MESPARTAFTLLDNVQWQKDAEISWTASGFFKERRVVLGLRTPESYWEKQLKKPLLHPELLAAKFALLAFCPCIVVLLQCLNGHVHPV